MKMHYYFVAIPIIANLTPAWSFIPTRRVCDDVESEATSACLQILSPHYESQNITMAIQLAVLYMYV